MSNYKKYLTSDNIHSGTLTVPGDTVITGDLTVYGTTTMIECNTRDLDVECRELSERVKELEKIVVELQRENSEQLENEFEIIDESDK